jgi:hypothetical protein
VPNDGHEEGLKEAVRQMLGVKNDTQGNQGMNITQDLVNRETCISCNTVIIRKRMIRLHVSCHTCQHCDTCECSTNRGGG